MKNLHFLSNYLVWVSHRKFTFQTFAIVSQQFDTFPGVNVPPKALPHEKMCENCQKSILSKTVLKIWLCLKRLFCGAFCGDYWVEGLNQDWVQTGNVKTLTGKIDIYCSHQWMLNADFKHLNQLYRIKLAESCDSWVYYKSAVCSRVMDKKYDRP